MDWIVEENSAHKDLFKYKTMAYSVVVHFDTLSFDIVKSYRGVDIIKEQFNVGKSLINYVISYKNKYNAENKTLYYHKHYETYSLRDFAYYCANIKIRDGKGYMCRLEYPYDSKRIYELGFTKEMWSIVPYILFEAYVSAYELLLQKICEAHFVHKRCVYANECV